MTVGAARSWLILFSLFVTAAVLCFIWLAPALFGYPLDAAGGDSARLIQIVLPVFLGYLGAASHFAFRDHDEDDLADSVRLRPTAAHLIRWPLVLWVLIAAAALGGFWWTNRPGAEVGVGWTVDDLASALTVSMGLLAVTTGVAVSYLFAPQKAPPNTSSATGGTGAGG